jgi:hypothetical protein
MRIASAACALCFGLMVIVNPVPSQPAEPTPAAPTPVSSAPVTSAPSLPPSDAAAKHAKRTACLQEARTKKLVGAEKTAFLKGCIESP